MVAETSVGFTAVAVDYDPFAGPEIAGLVPTTESQAEVWMACMLGGDDANRAYNESVSLQLNGALNPVALDQAVQALIRRHEALRAAFSADGAQMCVFRQRPIELAYDDISLRSEIEKEQFIAGHVKQEALYVFDLTQGPLLKASLIKRANDVYHFTLTAHHIICDGWSVAIVLQDLSKLYSAYAQNRVPDLPEAARFSRFADEQFLFAKSADYQKLEQFWMEQYRATIPMVNLPTDVPRPALRTFASERLDYALEPELLMALKKMGAKEGCSFVTTLLAAFEVFIHQLTGQDALIIGLPAAGQSATGAVHVVGHCVNLLPLRSHPTGGVSFAAYLKQRKSELFDAYEHQRLTFGSLLRKLNVARDPSRVPLVPVVFNIDTGMDDGVAFYGLRHLLIGNPKAYENFEIFLNANGSGDRMTLEWGYNTQLFKAETMQRMTVAFNELLQALVANPGAALATLPAALPRIFGEIPAQQGRQTGPVVTDEKLRPHLNGRAVTMSAPLPGLEFIDELFDVAAGENRERVAVIFQDQRISYEQLNRRADQLSQAILHHAPHDEIIGVSATRGLAMVVSILAILKAGKAYLPLDPAYPSHRLQQIVSDSRIGVCVAPERDLDLFQTLGLATIPADNHPTYPNRVAIRRQANACVLYTSGSTGKPKGVCLGHTGLINLVRWQQTHTTARAGMNTLQFCHLSFDASFQEIFVPLLTGGTIHLIDDSLRLNAASLLEFIGEQSIHRLFLPYVALQYLAEAADAQNSFPTTLTEVTTGGDLLKITPQIARFFDALPNCTLMNVYGPTEASIWVTELKLKGDALNWPKIPTIGRPIAGLDVFFVDEAMQLVEDGEVGELCISGVCLAMGYLNDPVQTAERFVNWTHPQRGDIRIYKTGDLACYVTGGEIEFHGRKDNQVKIRGNRVELGEVEIALNQEETVQQAVVVAREEAPGQKRLVAYLVSVSAEVDTLPIKQRLEQQLPDYMIPSAFVWLRELPQTSSGKVDRQALPEPDLMRPDMSVSYRSPTTPLEAQLVGLWEEALKLDKIGVDDNFFELGGHSLIAVQFMMRLERETGKRLPLSTLFEYATIHKLAALVTAEEQPGTLKSLVPIKPSGSKMPVYIIHGDGLNVLNFSGLAAHMDADQPVYGLQARGLDGLGEPSDNMEAIATTYVDEIVAQNPSGPYAIAGYSFGGYVGIEMARQLKARGKVVKMLAMFDTNTANVVRSESKLVGLSKKVARQLPKFIWITKSLLNHPFQTINYQLVSLRQRVMGAARDAGLLREPPPEGLFAIMKRINKKHDVAMANYQMKVYDGVIDLFRAKIRFYYVDDFAFLGWDRYASEGVRVHQVPGDHKSMLLPPNDKEFAHILQKALDNC